MFPQNIVWIIGALALFSKNASAQYDRRQYNNMQYANEITIAQVTDRDDNNMRLVLEVAIENVNRRNETKLAFITDNIPFGNSFAGYNKICDMMQRGIGAVVGPSSRHTAYHLMSICDTKDIPYFYSFMGDAAEAFNLYPHADDMGRALHGLVTAFEWSSFIFLYESSEYLNIFNALIAKYIPSEVPILTVLRYDTGFNGDYKQVLRRVRVTPEKKIVVVGSTETMPEFLRQALQVGIINEDYKYIIGNLDFHSFDLEEFKYSEANITSLRMFSPELPAVKQIMAAFNYTALSAGFQNGSCPVTMEMALTYDAIQLFAETTKHIPLNPEPMGCADDDASVANDGSTFKNFMRSMSMTENTITGNINFDGNVRKGFTFDVIELQPSGVVKVGTWDDKYNFTSLRLASTTAQYDSVDSTLANKTFIILLPVPNDPYASFVASFNKLTGNEQYEGYAVDLIKSLAAKLGFNYTFVPTDNIYGNFSKATNVSTGMLKEIREYRADLAISDFTITSERQEAIDFTTPFMNLGIAILFTKPQKGSTSIFSFMDPFNNDVWQALGLSFIGVSLSFFILGRLAPSEWDNPCPCIEEPTELENQFTMSNSLWFTTGALLQQGSEIAPKALSVRTVASIWWFFTLIMVSSYTANLAAFLTVENAKVLIENVKDLAENKGGVQYGAKREGATRNFFASSQDPTYKKMNEYMNKNPHLLFKSNDEGVEHVKNNNRYAFLMESTTIEYNTGRHCTLDMVGNTLDEKGYGIAMRKEWEYRSSFNDALLELQEQGELETMKRKWWSEMGSNLCSTKKETADAGALTMANLGGIFIVLVVGSGMAMIHGIVSWMCFVYRKARSHKVPLKAAFKEEFKFVMEFTTYSRDLKTAASIYSPSRNSSCTIESLETENNIVGKN